MWKARNQQASTSAAGDSKYFSSRSDLVYPHRLNFYDAPPLFDVTLEEFEGCALDRLRILAEIESSAARNRSWEETKTVTTSQCLKYLPLNATSAEKVDRDSERRKDHLGHFVLRLAFCRSEELRRRFVKAESTLFKIRYETDDSKERRNFLNSRDFRWIAVDDSEKAMYREQLKAAYQGLKSESDRQSAFAADTFYKVKWTRVPDLIERRKVFLKGGWAYVPGRELASIVFQEFEVQLNKALNITAKSLPRLDEDTRLVPILNNLSQGFLAGVASDWNGMSSEATGDGITADMIDDMAKKHFPLCMRVMHSNLMKDHHLKHFGRLNYGLFLKALGVTIEEAIIFWRKSFLGGKVTEDRFNKEYKYNIRHSYGLEGKRANYPAKNCMQLLQGNDEYGCPYRYFAPDNLQTTLLAAYAPLGLKSTDLPEIMHTKKTEHFHVGCTRVFEITHGHCGIKKGEGVGDGESVTHPNQYAARSIELEKSKVVKSEAMDVDS
ncbi:eukaryotic and archaeal DNA primase, large subunit-domain-containing protein [Desarmillaria tabescens]|uniref:DNA primase large subunit n=1 Tax=Armillaria tabescens TaxID=1929756 RepID=A0AA39N6G7_ARMTA|nr:eukaryotic and archaeal DNA primase, large subunit-domain-containing protein [Desarmillaria tabescens]KAK0459647.1 eukaryotic and archaeal DNA primase, large subunit-domain-containing protein [Desarmillaria tabescens]